MKIVVWFSCGAASAVAAKLTIDKYGHENVSIVNNPIKEEHEDNYRFLKDCEKLFQHEIEFALNPNYMNASCYEVWEKGFMSGPTGASCTLQLKKKARQYWESQNKFDYIVLGFTVEEKKRHDKFVLTERDNVLPVLIDANISKQDCYDMLKFWGIEPPFIYKLGYPNANCIGCVKATSPTYWNHVRKTFPEVYEERAEQSKRIGCKLARYKGERVFLSDLPPDAKGKALKGLDFECGIFCEEKL